MFSSHVCSSPFDVFHQTDWNPEFVTHVLTSDTSPEVGQLWVNQMYPKGYYLIVRFVHYNYTIDRDNVYIIFDILQV